MKRFIILLATILPLSAMAQTITIDSLIDEYSLKENCTAIKISNAMLRSMEINIEAEYMRVLAVEDEQMIPTFSKQAREAISIYEVVMSVNTDGKSVEIYQNTSTNDTVSDIYIFVCDKEEGVLMHVTGKNLELSNMGSIISQF